LDGVELFGLLEGLLLDVHGVQEDGEEELHLDKGEAGLLVGLWEGGGGRWVDRWRGKSGKEIMDELFSYANA
jgi:hypothetical protein